MPIQGGDPGAEFVINAETVIKEKPIKWWQKVIDWRGLRHDQGEMIVRQTDLVQTQGEIIDEQREYINALLEMAIELKSLNDEIAKHQDGYIEILEAKVKAFESGCQCTREEK